MLLGHYDRGVQFVPTLESALFTDSVSASLGGLLSRRLQVTSAVGASSGLRAFSTTDRSLWTYYGGASLGFGLTRYLGISGGYNYYFLDVNDGTYSALGLPAHLSRHSISVFMSTWAPILQKGRRNDASR